MESINIEILNPKAKSLIKGLADLKLIKINKKTEKTEFSKLLTKLRKQSNIVPSLEEISNEVDQVRKLRYEK